MYKKKKPYTERIRKKKIKLPFSHNALHEVALGIELPMVTIINILSIHEQ